MVSCTSWTVENNRGGVCTCRCSDATLKSVQGTKRKVKLENIISDSSVMRSIYRAPSERLPYWAVLCSPSRDNCQVSAWMQERPLQVLSLGERFQDVRKVDMLKGTCV
ncbi:hypothetical protein QL285_074230 [Trifolium repens]|nr:hypothetical protein QL285_074230 [Trifolium repens]